MTTSTFEDKGRRRQVALYSSKSIVDFPCKKSVGKTDGRS